MAEAILEDIYESEMSPMEVDELRSVLEDVLVSSGKFPIKDINLWLDSFDKCEIDEHRYSLIEYAHTFAESGEEQEELSADILKTPLLSEQEKSELWTKIQRMDYVELSIFLELIEYKLRKAEKLEKDKIAIQKNHDLSVGQRVTLIKEFESKKVDDREKMVSKLPVIVAEFKRKNKSERIVNRVRDLIALRKAIEAREILNSGIVVDDKYRELEEQISTLEMDGAREFLLVA